MKVPNGPKNPMRIGVVATTGKATPSGNPHPSSFTAGPLLQNPRNTRMTSSISCATKSHPCTLVNEDPGTVPASANGRGFDYYRSNSFHSSMWTSHGTNGNGES